MVREGSLQKKSEEARKQPHTVDGGSWYYSQFEDASAKHLPKETPRERLAIMLLARSSYFRLVLGLGMVAALSSGWNRTLLSQDRGGEKTVPSSSSKPEGKKTPPAEEAQKNAEQSVKPGINKDFLSRELNVDEYIKKFEVESREVYSHRQQLSELLELEEGLAIADIGAGTGAYLNLFAERVGSQGKVFAVDISPRFIEHLQERVKEAGWKQVEVIACDDRQTGLAVNVIDRAYICDTYHHFEFPLNTMGSLYKAMKPGGMLVVVDFDRVPGKSRDWVLNHVRGSKEEFRAEIEAVGFQWLDEPTVEGLTENFIMRFRK